MENKKILKILKRYDLVDLYGNLEETIKWFRSLNDLQKKNLLSLNFDPDTILFDTEILANKDLLNKPDYLKRVEAFISIKNAEGWHHLFHDMVNKWFLDSPKFYQDIETLKKAKCAQTPLWIIEDYTFVKSPYHDKDFNLLVTAKDNSDRDLDFVVWENIATLAASVDSIRSKYHEIDMDTIIRYGSKSLQTPHSYPESTITYLATNKVSLEDKYHLENMEILASNSDVIGAYLYQIMTDAKAINRRDYRAIIREMVEHKDNEHYAYLLCAYVLGEEKARRAEGLGNVSYDFWKYDMEELYKMVDEKLNVVDSDFCEVESRMIETTEKPKTFFKRFKERLSKDK
jgi:hypothetical protein